MDASERSPANARIITAPHGTTLTAKSWLPEAAFRMIQNNLDPDVAEKPDELIVYGGTGRAARPWQAVDRILSTLKRLQTDENPLLPAGKTLGGFPTHGWAPPALIPHPPLLSRS